MNTSHTFLALLAGLVLVAASACASQASGVSPSLTGAPVSLRLGYFPNLSHAPAIIGLEQGFFVQHLGPNVTLSIKRFNAGPSVIEAIFANELDISYIGPNPAVNGYVRSNGKALRIVSGAVSGGALFVVRPDSGIERSSDLANKRIATPQLGNTQDVALRAYLQAAGLGAKEQGGNVELLPTDNPNILTLFQKGDVHGAWVPEPWATRLVQQAGGRVFLDERSLWPGGDFVTTNIIVRKAFLDQYPGIVKAFLEGHLDAIEWANGHAVEAKGVVNAGIKTATGAALPQDVIDGSWEHLRLTADPIAGNLRKSAADAFKLGFLGTKEPDLREIYALGPLDEVLAKRGQKPGAH